MRYEQYKLQTTDLEVRLPATRRTQLAVSSVAITLSFALRLSPLNLRRQVVMRSITERWIVCVLALAY